MKTAKKLILKYKNGESPDNIAQIITNADETDLRILAYIAFSGDCDSAKIKRELNIKSAEFDASVKYWRGAGIIGIAAASEASDTDKEPEKSTGKSADGAAVTAHRNGKRESSDELPDYSTEELTELMKKRSITSQFIDEASRIYGKIFNQHEVGIIVRMIDYIGFDEECVLMLLSYYSKNGKKPLRYIERAALALYDEGITNAPALQEKLKKLEKSHELESEIRALFGMKDRSLTTKEKKFLCSWVDMGFDIDVIRLAYDITVDNTRAPDPRYTNGILERWYADGLTTYDKVTKALEEGKNKSSSKNKVGSSFDTDDFFEAALRRSYDD